MPRIARIATRKKLHELTSDVPPPAAAGERVAMVQRLRAEHHGWDDATAPDLNEFIGCRLTNEVGFL
ncbi:MAG: hypothetical protein OEW29_19665, partial [Acidimicrobiia bacterium]|nr:hypothetical protein [Acidimicrobiia bacterium]